MKRVGFLFEKITADENIIKAIKNATKHKKNRRGIVLECHEHPERFVKRIQKMLESEDFKFAPPIEKVRRERKKIRHIKVPQFFPDQIIHWALMQVIDPVINRGMDRYCCGSVKGRGGVAAKKAIEKFQKRDPKCKYVLKTDIHHFFESVDNEILKQKFRRVIKDQKVLRLIDGILDSGGDGLPIGYYTSQGFSNFYLQDFDHYVKEKLHIKNYARYADDMVFRDPNKRRLHKGRLLMLVWLKKEKLRFKGDWQLWRVYTRPIDFVGYRFYQGYTLLRKKLFYSLTKAVRRIQRFGMRAQQIKRFLSYMGWTKRINFKRYYQEHIKPVITKGRAKKYMSWYARTFGTALAV